MRLIFPTKCTLTVDYVCEDEKIGLKYKKDVIVSVVPEGWAETVGIEVGDWIVGINGKCFFQLTKEDIVRNSLIPLIIERLDI